MVSVISSDTSLALRQRSATSISSILPAPSPNRDDIPGLPFLHESLVQINKSLISLKEMALISKVH